MFDIRETIWRPDYDGEMPNRTAIILAILLSIVALVIFGIGVGLASVIMMMAQWSY